MEFMLKYEGRLANEHQLDFYDAARALGGFQRSLALTAHLVANGEIITQAPALKNARILISTPQPGSWETVAMVVGGLWAVGTASKDTPFGHLLYSVYDFAVSHTLGFPVDFDKSLYQSYRAELEAKKITPAKIDSLSEKIENSVADMHRPVVASATASHGQLYAGGFGEKKIRLGREINEDSYEYIKSNHLSDNPVWVEGLISSYNMNTFTGRIFSFEEGRPIAFELIDGARHRGYIDLITSSLRANAIERGTREGAIKVQGYTITSSAGRLKGIRAFAAQGA